MRSVINPLNKEGESRFVLFSDSMAKPLQGGKCYKMYLPPDIPASKFWSVVVYDNLTRLIIRTDQLWPSVHSNCKKLEVNPDGSVDVWFGPNAPAGKENNWVQTIPGKGWHMVLRLYDALEPLFDKTWKLGEIEELHYDK